MIRKPTLWTRFRKRLWKVSKWGLGFLGVAIVSGYVYVRYDYLTAADDLEYQESLARENGFHLTAEDMKPRPPVKPEENAAPIYRKAFAAMDVVPKPKNNQGFADVLGAASLPGELNLKASRACIKLYAETIKLVKEAAHKPRCDFETDWSNPWDVKFPFYPSMKPAANILCDSAIVKARTGDSKGALEEIRSALLIPRHIEEEKTLIAALVAIAIEARTLRSIEHIASFLSNDSKSLVELAAILESLPEIPDFMQFLKGDVYFGYASCMHLRTISDQIERDRPEDPYESTEFYSDSPPFGNPTILVLPPIIESELCERAYAAKFLKVYNRAFEAAQGASDPYQSIAKQLDEQSLLHEGSLRPSDQMNKFIFPFADGVRGSFVKRSFYRETTKAYIKLILYRNRTGAFPKTLKEASIRSVEPYGKTVLNYKKSANGFRIYDVGPNGKDDGGTFSWENSSRVNTDDRPVFCFPTWDQWNPKRPRQLARSVAQFLSQMEEKGVPSNKPATK